MLETVPHPTIKRCGLQSDQDSSANRVQALPKGTKGTTLETDLEKITIPSREIVWKLTTGLKTARSGTGTTPDKENPRAKKNQERRNWKMLMKVVNTTVPARIGRKTERNPKAEARVLRKMC